MKHIIIWSLFFSIFFVNCSSEQASSDGINEDETRAVLEHHWETFKNNDLEGVMEDYTEESFLITPDTTYRGLDEIRDNFISAFKAFPADEDPLTLKKTVVEKDVGYIIWEASTSSMELRFATDTFIIRNGKIIRQTYGGITQSELE